MTRYVIDAPTLLHLVRDGLEVHADHQLVAPQSLRSGALQLLLDHVAAGELAEREALALHEAMTGIKVRTLGDRVSRRTAWTIAREHGWSRLAEAEHAAVTRLQADALVTVDPAMRALMTGVVPLAGVEVLSRP